MESEPLLPCVELRKVLLAAYDPCPGFHSICTIMRWIPEHGHVPRGFCGAVGQLSDVELVLIVAEPGDPHGRESYSPAEPSSAMFETVCRYVYECYASGKDQFHKNIRYILDLCWPGLPIVEQMRRTWITESTLCSAETEGGRIQSAVNRFCVDSYLSKQLDLLPQAVIATLGGKARDRVRRLEHEVISASAAAPPGCNFRGAKESWEQIAAEVQMRRSA